MKKSLLAAAVIGLFACGVLHAGVEFQESAGVGLVVSDNESLDSAPIGKLDAQWNLKPEGSRLMGLLGLSASKSGSFARDDKPQAIRYADANPQAFAGKSFHPHGGDTIILEGDDITNVFITDAKDPLPKRPADAMERSFWATDVFMGAAYEMGPLAPFFSFRVYGKAGIGAAGVKQYDGDSRLGVSETLIGGVEANLLSFFVGAEATRRFTQTEINTYGSWAYMAKAGLRF